MNAKPLFYRPVFDNDNFYAPDMIDVAAFSAFAQKPTDPAADVESVSAKTATAS